MVEGAEVRLIHAADREYGLQFLGFVEPGRPKSLMPWNHPARQS